MAAISYPSAAPRRSLSPRPAAPAERHLRLIQGGRPGAASRVAPGVYSRRRIVALVLAAVVAILAVVAVEAAASALLVREAPAGPPATGAAAVAVPAGAEIHVVQPGETVWAIASELTTDGDVRATVDRLVEQNGGSAALRVGQRLVLG